MCRPYSTDRGMTIWSLSLVRYNLKGLLRETIYIKKINILPWIIRIMLTDTFLEQLGH